MFLNKGKFNGLEDLRLLKIKLMFLRGGGCGKNLDLNFICERVLNNKKFEVKIYMRQSKFTTQRLAHKTNFTFSR